MFRFIIFAVTLFLSATAYAQMKINELMSNNISFVMDEYMNFSMWAEVYNSGASEENMNDYYFTDNLSYPQKWRPDHRTVPAGGFARLWFVRPELAGHANFKLKPDGGTLYLLKNGNVVDSMSYPVQIRNVSWGRLTDGGDSCVYFAEPSTTTELVIENPAVAIAGDDFWNYRYTASPPPDEWNKNDYDDSGWIQNSRAPLGYGKSSIITQIGSPYNPPVQTAYFRKKINIADASKIYACNITANIDDAAAFFVNGTEVFRYNLEEGQLSYDMAAITGRTDFARFNFFFPSSLLHDGDNIIAAEVHQQSDLASSDLYFSLTLTLNDPDDAPPLNINSNNGRKTLGEICAPPEFSTAAGFYTDSVNVSFYNPDAGSTIRYTTDGSEPSPQSPEWTGTPLHLTQTACIRAATFVDNHIQGNVVSATFFVDERQFTLPVVSIITDSKFLFDDRIGIYTEGENYPGNYWWDWERPANFELFDTLGKACLNQELDIALAGQYSQEYPQKSLKISPRQKFGDNRLRFDFFESKKGKKYKDIQIRNSGNDWDYSMLRDAFMQTLIIDRLDVDYLAYQPIVIFMNGEYYGLENLRERSSKDYLYTNYNLDEDEIILTDQNAAQKDGDYISFRDYLINNAPSSAVYQYAESKMDIGSLIDYFITEIYINNTDWLVNNYKYWKPLSDDGKWRFILYDTDYGFGWDKSYDYNMVEWTFGRTSGDFISAPIQRLLQNSDFKKRFLSRFAVHLATTFAPVRVKHILDSLSSKISDEIVYHKAKFNSMHSFDSEITKMRNFADKRANSVMTHLNNFFFTLSSVININLTANEDNVEFTFNGETVPDPSPITIKYFKNNQITVRSSDVENRMFSHWEYMEDGLVKVSTDRELTLSPLMTTTLNAVYTDFTGIPSLDGRKTVREIRCFDILGRPVDASAKGYIIKQTVYDDNSIKTEKIFAGDAGSDRK